MNEVSPETAASLTTTYSLIMPGNLRRWASRFVLFALPVVLALVGYYRAQLGGSALPRPQGDAAFYAYQLQRAAECHGQWWRIAADSRLGHPYPSEFAKHPGLYEGVDLMLVASLLGGAASAAKAYHLAVILALTVNGWIAAWIVFKITRKTLWAVVAVALVTLNESVAVRVMVHLHLFKFGWALLAVWAFVAFLKQPAWWRGLLLGFAVALLLQASFYLGFFTGLGLGFWFALELLAGRVRPSALAGTVVAALAFILAAALFCFPVWTNYSPIVGSDQYFHRYWAETWIYGSEVWKYFIPKNSWLAANYFRDLRHKAPAPTMDEGWNFPGYTVVIAVLIAGVAWLRGSELSKKLDPFVGISLGLMAFWMILSLAGGPSALVFHVIPSFRCYGRAGLLVVALGSVVAPIVLCELVNCCRRRFVRAVLTLGLLALVASDAGRAAVTFKGWPPETTRPDWVDWLRHQPPDARLAIFMTHPAIPTTLEETTGDNEPFYWWGVSSLEWLAVHGHATLSGGTFSLIEGDLRLLGASYDQMNPAGLRYVASLGYSTLAVHYDYLRAHPWIDQITWLNRVDRRGEWLFYQPNDQLAKIPTTSLDQVLTQFRQDPQPREAPPGCWITGSWPVDHDTIVGSGDWGYLAWSQDQGRLVSEPQPALYQHVFGPSIPAYTIRTPSRPGDYRLVVLDRNRRGRASFDYQIVADRAVSQPTFPPRRPKVTVHPVSVAGASPSATGPQWELTLTNTSSVYLQSQVFRQHLSTVCQTHPGLKSQWIRASDGGMVLKFALSGTDCGAVDAAREIPMPEDLPPGGCVKLRVPADRLPSSWVGRALTIEPSFSGVGQAEAPAETADLRLSIKQAPSDIAQKPQAAERGRR
jgi:hypothetical protein